jgi:hypothetical protein
LAREFGWRPSLALKAAKQRVQRKPQPPGKGAGLAAGRRKYRPSASDRRNLWQRRGHAGQANECFATDAPRPYPRQERRSRANHCAAASEAYENAEQTLCFSILRVYEDLLQRRYYPFGCPVSKYEARLKSRAARRAAHSELGGDRKEQDANAGLPSVHQTARTRSRHPQAEHRSMQEAL